MTSNTMGNGELLVLKDLYVWYTKGKPVLEKFSLELKRNEVVGLIGLNGAGKTTFIKTLSGLLDSFQAETALWLDKPLMSCWSGFILSVTGRLKAICGIIRANMLCLLSCS